MKLSGWGLVRGKRGNGEGKQGGVCMCVCERVCVRAVNSTLGGSTLSHIPK